MREIFEFRIPEEWACEWLNRDDGVRNRSGTVRIVKALYRSDLYERVLAAERERRTVDERFFFGWTVRREYDAVEIAAAEVFTVRIRDAFEPVGEEFGAVYFPDVHGPAEAENRVGELSLECSRFGGSSFCTSIAGERLASREVQDLVRNLGLTGVRFGSIRCAGSAGKTDWAELIVTSRKLLVVPPTIVADGPLDRGRTPLPMHQENLGLNVLSEVWIQRDSWDGSDFMVSRQTVGAHQGVLRPERLLFVSSKMFAALSEKMKRGIDFEVTNLV